jgi:hypothetical protein
MSQEKFYASLANQAYIKKEDRDNDISDFELDTELSDTRHAVYHNPIRNHTILAVRGTKTDLSADSIEDLGTDAMLAIGNLTATKRYSQAQKKLYATQAKYGRTRLDLVGHSLGGRTVEELGAREENINQVHSFNPGSFLKDWDTDLNCKTSKSKQCEYRKSRVHRYTVAGDPLSMTSHTGQGIKKHKHYAQPRPGLDPHTVKNFL